MAEPEKTPDKLQKTSVVPPPGICYNLNRTDRILESTPGGREAARKP